MAVYKLGPIFCHFQMVSLIPLLLAIYLFFMFCSCEKITKVFDKALCGNVVYFISALTLEIYLVQYALFTDRMNFMFPLNIPIMYVSDDICRGVCSESPFPNVLAGFQNRGC